MSSRIRLKETVPQAPKGTYIAKCIHVDPNWTYLRNRKVALYFEIMEGVEKGKQARRFYNLQKYIDGYASGDKSKFRKDLKKLFPEHAEQPDVEVKDLFVGVFFSIQVIEKRSRDGSDINAIVENIERIEVGF